MGADSDLPSANALSFDHLPEEYRRCHRFGGRVAARQAEALFLRRQIDAAVCRLLHRLAAHRATQLGPGKNSGSAKNAGSGRNSGIARDNGIDRDWAAAHDVSMTLLRLRDAGLALVKERDQASCRDDAGSVCDASAMPATKRASR